MPDLLLQSAVTSARNERLAAEAQRISDSCRAQHGDSKSLVECADCYGALLDAFRARFLNPDVSHADQPSSQKQQPREWLTHRNTFLSDLDQLLGSAKAYDIPPQAVDDRVNEERSRWYAETVRGCLLRLMVEDPAEQGVVFEKLEDLASVTTAADPVVLAREIADMLSRGPLAPGDKAPEAARDLPSRLAAAAAGDAAASAAVLERAFFADEAGAVPDENRRYLDMLRSQGLSMEQVVDRILEDRQAATGAHEQTNKLRQRLEELRRARAAHEAQKTRRAQRRESLAQQRVPDELYELPACAVCGEAPTTSDFYCCSLCAILVAAEVREKQTVFCSEKCEKQGHASHAETHPCSAGPDCTRRQPASSSSLSSSSSPKQAKHGNSNSSSSSSNNNNNNNNTTTNPEPAAEQEDTPMLDAPPPPEASAPTPAPAPKEATSAPADIRFCTECLATLKQPTAWCSLACADASFARHRDEVHLPRRKARGEEDPNGDEALFELVEDEDGGDEDGGDESKTKTKKKDDAEGGAAAGASSGHGDGEGDSGDGGGGDGGKNATAKRKGRRRAKDVAALTTSLEDAVREWEAKHRVRLHTAAQPS
ncbi:hypothetical protein VTJ83DRAFT_1642 [Remersonia thermophila]|uniref:MYND-type domain-containing protein n=1 Tax=Remersonia thermophila TaxID=72144 RepID=A0ABR4DGH3_9PEZI